MADETERHPVDPEFVRTLAQETGATEEQIKSIIELIGNDRGSIIRETKLLQPTKRSE